MEKIICDMSKAEEVFFLCNKENSSEILTEQDIDDAWERLNRFAAYVQVAFPETKSTNGIIDSPIQLINETKSELENIENATHLVWLTGGSLVPEDEWKKIGI